MKFTNIMVSSVFASTSRYPHKQDDCVSGYHTGSQTLASRRFHYWLSEVDKHTRFKQGKVCSIEPKVGEFVLIKDSKKRNYLELAGLTVLSEVSSIVRMVKLGQLS
jgi:hypothetical protein